MTLVHPSSHFQPAANPLIKQIAEHIHMPETEIESVIRGAGIKLTDENVGRVQQVFKAVLAARRVPRQP